MRRTGTMLLGLAMLGAGTAAAQERETRATPAAYAARVAALDSVFLPGIGDAEGRLETFAAVAPPEELDQEHERLLEAAKRWAAGDRWQWKRTPARTSMSSGGCTTTGVTYGDYEADGSRNRETQTTCSRDVSIRTNPEPRLHNARSDALGSYREARRSVAERLERAGATLPEAPSAHSIGRERSVFTSVPRQRL